MATGSSKITWYLQDLLGEQNAIFSLCGVELRIGREEYCEIRCEYKIAISRCHGKLKFLKGQWHIEDQSLNGIAVNGHPVPRDDLVALNDGDVITLANETVAVYKFMMAKPAQNADNTSVISSESLAARETGQETTTTHVTGSTAPPTGAGMRRKQVRIASRDSELQVETDHDSQPTGLVDATEIFNSRLLQATHGRNSLDLTRQRFQKLSKNQTRMIQDLQEEQKELKRQNSELLEKLSENEEKRKRTEMNLDAMTDHNVEIQGHFNLMATRNAELQEAVDRVTSRNSEIQKILEEEAKCSICLQVVIDCHETDCRHLFCHTCIVAWRDHGFACPLCRKAGLRTEESAPVNNIVRRLYAVLPEEVQRERQAAVEDRRQIQVQRELNTHDNDAELWLNRMEEEVANFLTRPRINVELTATAPARPIPPPRTQPVNRRGNRPGRLDLTLLRQHYQSPYARPTNQLIRRNLQTSVDFNIQ